MVVKLGVGKQLLFPLTSPPSKPMPEPDPKLIAKAVSYGDREIVVTIPFPDTVELLCPILNDLLEVADLSGKPAKQTYNELDQDIKASLPEVKMGLPATMSGSFNKQLTKATFYVQYDPAQPLNRARITLARRQKEELPSWTVKLEFSPSKAGAAGLVQLTSALQIILPYVNIQKLLAAFRVARLDAAIDLLGATPLDLIAHVPKPGKRQVFVGSHGRPETVYFYEQKSPLKVPPSTISSVKTVGPQRLTLYERRDYHLQLLLEPPYGACPVTRAEVTKRWKKGRPALSDLPTLGNMFKGRRIAYAAAVPTKATKPWRQFCLATFGAGLDKSFWSWLPGPAGEFEGLYRDCVGDLVEESCWEAWQDGLDQTGLSSWIKADPSAK